MLYHNLIWYGSAPKLESMENAMKIKAINVDTTMKILHNNELFEIQKVELYYKEQYVVITFTNHITMKVSLLYEFEVQK